MKIEKFLLHFHFVCFVCLFISLIPSTVSNEWSVAMDGYQGLFKKCYILSSCNRHTSKTFIAMQVLQITTCIATICGLIYCFISILLKKFVHAKLYVLSLFYVTVCFFIIIVLALYTKLVHQSIKSDKVNYGWPVYAEVFSILVCVVGALASILFYSREKNKSVLRIQAKDLRR
ncbi:uncharacterized protein LOC130635471 isoform X1 [Hydractinia symbiolongicarpus]|uniref:uncharacterized protein LOC130635471 isoform X1 n=1 Tax=Hydractinia symbiolongicarpus TaxID=13093 RepID=UPI0025513ECE|nr:uncharacterized protein LOC130635471 isoform X1 [Hydractinia symbiolongicarpus]